MTLSMFQLAYKFPIFLFIGLMISMSFSSQLHAQWVQTNGPGGGQVYKFAISGTNILAGTNAGVIRSTNNGESWTISGFLGGQISQLITLSEKNILASNGNGFIFRSENSGQSWNEINSSWTQGRSITAFTAIGTNLFASVSFGGGVFRSTDNGTSWTEVNNGLTDTFVSSLAALGTNLFAGTYSNGIFRSTDNGASWTNINVATPNPYIYTLFANSNNLFVGTDSGVYLSTNNGSSFTQVNIGLPSLVDIASFGASGGYIFAGSYSKGIFRSDNNGASWTQVNNGLNALDVYDFSIIGTNILAGTLGGGIYVSSNSGTSWAETNTGFIASQVYSFAVNGTNLFAGIYGGGVSLSTNNGADWTNVSSGLTYMGITSLAIKGTDLFAGTDSMGIFRSTDNGSSWTATGLTSGDVNTIAVSGSYLFAGTNIGGVRRSTDNGNTWTAVNSGLSLFPFVSAIAVSGTDLFAIDNNWGGGIYHSTNNGTNWSNVSSNLSKLEFFGDLAVSSNGANIFAGAIPGGTGGQNEGVYRSTDNGANWTAVNSGLINRSVIDFGVSGSDIFVTTWDGVYLSTNNGDNWTNISSSDLPEYEFLYSPTVFGANLFVAVNNSGVWSRPLSQITSVDENFTHTPSNFILEQNYPNPFNPSTVIKFGIPTASNVKIEVFNVTGENVATLVDGFKSEGSYEVSFNASGLPSGMYFYKIQSNNFSETKKMVLLK